MHRSTVLLAACCALLGVLVGTLGLSTWRLSHRVAALEVVTAPGQLAQRTGADPADVQAIEKAVAVWREARAGGGAMTEDEAAALVEAALDEALDRKAAERKTAEVDRYMEMAEESMRMEVEDLGRDFGLTAEQVNRVVDLLVQGMYEGHQLREDVKDGALSVRAAKEEGEAIKEQYVEALTEILGEEAYEALGQRFYGDGGWSAAR